MSQETALKKQDLSRRKKDLGLPPRLAAASIASLKPNQKALADAYAGGQGAALILGPSGVGKSWTAAALANLAIENGHKAAWVNVPRMFAALRDEMFAERREGFSLLKHVDSLVDGLDYLFLDDLGAHRATDWAVETLYLVLDAWDSSGKRGIVCTTNLAPEGIAKEFSDRVASRLCAGAEILRLNGPDLRGEK